MAKLKEEVFQARKEWFENNRNKYSSIKDITQAFNEHFNLNLKENGVYDFMKRLKMNLGARNSYTDVENEWIKQNYSKFRTKELTRKYNQLFNKNMSCKKMKEKKDSMGLSYLKANKITHSQCLTKYKIGDVIFEDCGKVFVKIRNNMKTLNYENASRFFYQMHYNEKLNCNELILHLDGDKTNFNKDNLITVSTKDKANLMHYRNEFLVDVYGQGKVTEAFVKLSKLETLVKEIEKGKEEGE